MPTRKRKFGDFGERVAREFLERKGYVFCAQNIHSRFGEIDLLMKHRGRPVCVEVKLRTSLRFGRPEESITAQKQQKILKTWHSIKHKKGLSGFCRIEAVSILLDVSKKKAQVWHFTDLST